MVASELPALTDLELWIGTPDYGGDTEVADLAPLLAGERFPALRRLGLRNAEIADALVTALPGVRVDVSDPQEDHRYGRKSHRYTAVGE
ncbi:hypothetical protein [Micromonospora sp. NBRC 101691]|uniref:hypothetical protein n=1 Tax=Micromonospora sp. NBRC 101691 TaxID=3032198 RepID=UPI0024A2D1BE|nr:hypothetical protein [Micromonospora sp. NBRC 101691]GLY24951.1 hypothetical protein Misp04_46830 [Micromonospora sp. NBRC 101691]